MPPNIEENSRYLYLSFIFCFTFKIYIYIRNENGRVGNNRIRNFVIRKPKFPTKTPNIWNIKKLIIAPAATLIFTTIYVSSAKAVYDRSLDEEQWASDLRNGAISGQLAVKSGGKASNGNEGKVHREKSW